MKYQNEFLSIYRNTVADTTDFFEKIEIYIKN